MERAGTKAPSTAELGLTHEAVHDEIRRQVGLDPAPLPPRATWPLHLKETTIADMDAIRRMPTLHKESKTFLLEALEWISARPWRTGIAGNHTSRTIKPTSLTPEEVQRYVAMGKAIRIEAKEPLAARHNAVNVWKMAEMKARSRVITEPHLNGTTPKSLLPRPQNPSRLQRRQGLKRSKYMIQIDFDAFYNAIPIEEEAQGLYIFKSEGDYYALTTLPTGARWSVAVGQAITWVITDIIPEGQKGIAIFTMIDNIVLAGEEGFEDDFLHYLEVLLRRMEEAALQTTPRPAELRAMDRTTLLRQAAEPNTFLGEVYTWDTVVKERTMTNSPKTLAKLALASTFEKYTYRTFAGLVSLILFAMHTQLMNAAIAYRLLKAYRAIGREISRGGRTWDQEMSYLAPAIRDNISGIVDVLLKNTPSTIPDLEPPSYDDAAYNQVIFVDASGNGWGALARDETTTIQYQQQWVNTLGPQNKQHYTPRDNDGEAFMARFSAHAEPMAITRMLAHLQGTNRLGKKVAVVTDHYPIAHAQRKLNGFGGIGRGRTLNNLFDVTNVLAGAGHTIHYFYIPGTLNPADGASRNFGDSMSADITEQKADQTCLPFLRNTMGPLCDEATGQNRPEWMR